MATEHFLVYACIDWGDLCVLSFNVYEKISAMQIGLEDKEMI
jgi:hypothetical protein